MFAQATAPPQDFTGFCYVVKISSEEMILTDQWQVVQNQGPNNYTKCFKQGAQKAFTWTRFQMQEMTGCTKVRVMLQDPNSRQVVMALVQKYKSRKMRLGYWKWQAKEILSACAEACVCACSDQVQRHRSGRVDSAASRREQFCDQAASRRYRPIVVVKRRQRALYLDARRHYEAHLG